MKRAGVWAGEYRISAGDRPYPIPYIWVDAFEAMGYQVDILSNPTIAELQAIIPTWDAMAYIAHGKSNFVYTQYGTMFRPSDIPEHKLQFVHAYTCDGLEWDTGGTWADIYTRNGGVFISYDDIPDLDGSYEQKMVWDWQEDYIAYLLKGHDVGLAFDEAVKQNLQLLDYFVPKIYGNKSIKITEGEMTDKIYVVISQTGVCHEFTTSKEAETFIASSDMELEGDCSVFMGRKLSIKRTALDIGYSDANGDWVSV